jgi:carbohydrate-selective porin OprB
MAHKFAANVRFLGASSTDRRNSGHLKSPHTYAAQIATGWTVQPDIQYIVHPGGGATDPNSATGQRIPDALVFGMRMTVQWGDRDPNSMQ